MLPPTSAQKSVVAPDAGFNLFNKLSDYQRISRELTSASGATALGSAMTSRRYRARFCCGGITGGTEKENIDTPGFAN
jgi:hypothetical protein